MTSDNNNALAVGSPGQISRRNLLKTGGASAVALTTGMALTHTKAKAQDMTKGADNFYKSDAVTLQKVTFQNQYKQTVAANLIRPKDANPEGPAPAIIVGHPMGAVKEQAATLYATKMAEYGYVTLALDLPYWGESEGEPRNLVAPDAYAEAFSAAADYLSSLDFVDPERIGAIGVCASGGFAIAAAKIDPRIKAIATASMIDMGGATRMMVQDPEQWLAMTRASVEQRMIEFAGGQTDYTGGTVLEVTEETPQFQRDFYEFYRTSRGKVVPKGATDVTITRPTLSSNNRFLNFYPLNDIEKISPRPILFLAGENAISLELIKAAHALAAEPKELLVVAEANHVDLYDRTDLIPFDKLNAFFESNL
ncbi:alpha/beta hydrolase [Cohaesibacter haloalkalitolerans]|uniref:alpha/beta hydrolase n=1 Tax=Cohaesibacter haloalkalitolerans TaxID=1162980 RepID=UPI001969911C|nr:alpha/beta hydrolase [Cohaesibacter haloalkalitolerans]